MVANYAQSTPYIWVYFPAINCGPVNSQSDWLLPIINVFFINPNQETLWLKNGCEETQNYGFMS